MAVGYHLTFRLNDSRVIAPSVAARRRIARSFVEIGDRYGLLAFRVVVDHGHAALVCDRASAGRAAQAIGSSITQALGLPDGFNVTHVKPIVDQAHLERTFSYILGNAEHHGATDDPLHDASALPDLLGLRVLGSEMEARVQAHLPKVTRASLRSWLGIAPTELTFAPQHLADAAAAVFALPTLRGKSPAHQLARAAAVQLAKPHLRAEALAVQLHVGQAAIRRVASLSVPSIVVDAVRRGMTLRAALGERGRAGLAGSARPNA